MSGPKKPPSRLDVFYLGQYMPADDYDALMARVAAAPPFSCATEAKLRTLLRPSAEFLPRLEARRRAMAASARAAKPSQKAAEARERRATTATSDDAGKAAA